MLSQTGTRYVSLEVTPTFTLEDPERSQVFIIGGCFKKVKCLQSEKLEHSVLSSLDVFPLLKFMRHFSVNSQSPGGRRKEYKRFYLQIKTVSTHKKTSGGFLKPCLPSSVVSQKRHKFMLCFERTPAVMSPTLS